MTNQDAAPHLQAVRRVDPSRPLSLQRDAPADIIYLVCHSDPSSGKDIILWDDVLAAFKEDVVVHIRNEAVVIPFLKGLNFENLYPLRIAAIPGITLDVVVKGGQLSEKEQPLECLHNVLPGTPQESSASKISNSDNVPTARRNPAGGLVEEAMDAYRNNDNPAFVPRLRGPQAILDNPLPPPASDTPPPSQKSIPGPQTVAPEKSIPGPNKVFDEKMEKAESGDKDAQFEIGGMYYYAQGVPQDYSTAMDWYLKAARQGHAGAQNEIGCMNQYGQGTPQDYTAAMYWHLKSANQGHASAQNNVGWLYRSGHGVPQDYSVAMDWYLKAARQGHAVAQSNIGILYEDGLGVPQDYSSAKDWYLEAARQGNAVAQSNIGMLYQGGLGIPQNYLQAKSWYQRAADQGNAAAQYLVAQMYEQGLGVSKDREKSIEWYRKAVAGGDEDAKVSLDRLEKQSSGSVAGDTKGGLFEWLFK
ncbi:hypothetical protein BGX24_002469 [Mortierella sp. AD032]|nr:hypothetical protein BGX24_002469 [Mortierella sp. AD032]